MEVFIQLLYALPVYQSAVLAVVLFLASGREKGHSRLIMGFFLSAIFIYFSFNFFFYIRWYAGLVWIYFLILPVILVFIPFFFLYLESITIPGFHFRKSQLWHFLPAGIIVFLTIPYLFTSQEEKFSLLSKGLLQPHDSAVVVYLLVIYMLGTYLICNLQLMYYIYRSLRLFHKHRIYIANRYSFTENISLTWIKALILFFVLFFLSNEFFYIFGVKHFIASRIFYNIGMLGFILFTGYHGLTQKDLGKEIVLEEEMQKTGNTEMQECRNDEMQEGRNDEMQEGDSGVPLKMKYAGSSLTEDQKQALIDKLEKLMIEERPYLDNDLSLDDVARSLGTNTKYISRILNEDYRKNFFTFINTYRVEEAKRLLSADKERKYSIIGIAQMSGFSSKSSFNEAFRQITGDTPSDFRKKLVS